MNNNIIEAAERLELEYCYLKLVEECSELSEVAIKFITKPNNSEERIPHLIEELGDVELRIKILSDKLNIRKEVKDRIETKLNSL